MTLAPLLLVCTLLGSYDFELPDSRQAIHRLSDLADQRLTVLVFLGTECPLARLYGATLNQIVERYQPHGVAVVGINSNTHDSATDVAAFADELGLRFPILLDAGQHVADRFGATRQLEVFVLDRVGQIRYHGRIDDQYEPGRHRNAPSRSDLIAAIDELLTDQPVSVSQTGLAGCFIDRAPADGHGDITYSEHVAPILARHCVECHRPGQIGPFSLLNYQDAVEWSATIRERVAQGLMPPWHADPAHGRFANERRLSDDEKQLLFAWIDAGMAAGEPVETPAAPLPPPHDWHIGRPDKILTLPAPIDVPATGVIDNIMVEIDPGFQNDTWIRAVEVMPGNRKVLHHVTVVIAPPSEGDQAKAFEQSSVISGWTPGYSPLIPPPGMARMLPAGWHIYLQLHYVTTGVATSDATSLGLLLADDAQMPVWTNFLLINDFVLEPYKAQQQLEKSWRVPHDILLLSLFPHMHLRGRSFRYEAIYPDGRSEVLLNVPRYDFLWQHEYVLAEPKRLPAGTTLRGVAIYDNSADNPNNPDPSAVVKCGPQTTDEMFNGWFEYADLPAQQNFRLSFLAVGVSLVFALDRSRRRWLARLTAAA